MTSLSLSAGRVLTEGIPASSVMSSTGLPSSSASITTLLSCSIKTLLPYEIAIFFVIYFFSSVPQARHIFWENSNKNAHYCDLKYQITLYWRNGQRRDLLNILNHKGTSCSAQNAAYYQKGQTFFNSLCAIATMVTW